MQNNWNLPEPSLEPPPEQPLPRCPVCGEETDTFYKDKHGDVVGCDYCISRADAWRETA